MKNIWEKSLRELMRNCTGCFKCLDKLKIKAPF